MLRFALNLIFFQLLFIVSYARFENQGNGLLVGYLVTADHKPVPDIAIKIRSLRRSVLSNDKGQFIFKKLPAGVYEIEVSAIGYAPEKRSVTIEEDRTTSITIILSLLTQQLSEITVATGYNKFYKKETDDVARLPLKNMENPQVYSIVPKELMQEQVVTDYNSIFKNIPGAGIPLVYNQGRSAMLSRGFQTANLIRNSVSGFVYTNIDPANLEVLEAIKGPSGTLFNSSMISFGGLFNRVTKKPFDQVRNEITYSGASFDLNRLSFDLNHPLVKDKSILFRLNGAVHTEQSFQDAGFTRSYMLAPSFIFKVNEKLNFLLDIEASSFNATSPIRFAPYTKGTVHNIKDLGMPYRLSYLTNTLDYTTRQLNVFGQINYQLSNEWKLQTNFTRTFSTTKGYVTQLTGKSDSTLQQQAQKENFPYTGTDIQQNLIGDFKIAGLRNRIVVGIEFFNQKSNRSTPTVNMPVINFKHPGAAYYNFNADRVDDSVATGKNTTWDIQQTNFYTYSVYVSDVLNITDKLNIMMSLRGDRTVNKGIYRPAYDTTAGAYSQNAVSPKLGIVYEVIKNKVSLFGNYMNGFNNQAGADYYGHTFKPQEAYQWEGGIKLDMIGHRLNTTISYYNISVSNTVYADVLHNGYNVQDGTQISKGIEAEIIANPVSGLNIVAGYAYNYSKLTQSDSTTNGLRPAASGPPHLANLWASYRFLFGSLKGIGIGFGGNYGSESFQTNTQTFVFKIPAYTVLDATLFYDHAKYRIGLKLNNFTNERYWSFRLAPQNPTRFTASLTFRF